MIIGKIKKLNQLKPFFLVENIMFKDYLDRARIVKPFIKEDVVMKIKKIILDYMSIKNNISREERIKNVEEILVLMMNEPELFAMYPRLRQILSDKYYEFILESHRRIISDIPIFLNIISRRSDYVNLNEPRYNLRKRELKNYKV
jgi:hypothetical protein